MGTLVALIVLSAAPCAPETCEADCLTGAPAACVLAGVKLRATQPTRAVFLLERGCADRHGPACAELASLYWEGPASARTLALAQQYDAQACELHFGPSCVALASEEERAVSSGSAFEGMRRAAHWLEVGCEASAGAACTGLARLAAVGVGTPADATRAATLASRGCELGELPGCRLAAVFFAEGLGVPRSLPEAERLRSRGQSARELTLPPVSPAESGTVSMTSDPPGARVRVMGLFAGTTPFTVRLMPGDLSLEADRAGAELLSRRFHVDRQVLTSLELVWPATLLVDSTPGGANVRLDGALRGSAPLPLSLAPGPHVLELELEGHEPVRREVSLSVGERKVERVLLAKKAPVAIIECPQGARLELDGRYLGSCPWTGALPLGKHRVRLTLAGHLPLEQRLDLQSSEQRFALELRADPTAPGWLNLDTVPPSARVVIDGKPAGVAPLRVSLKPGRHKVTCTLPGFEPGMEEVLVETDGDLSRTLSLARVAVRAKFESVPPGAEVSVDGVKLGTTPLSASVRAGEHEVVFVLPGYSLSTRRWVVEAKGSARLRESLQTAPMRAQLRVETEPAGALVALDEQPLSATPVQVEVSPGEHRLRVSADQHEPATLTLSLAPGERMEKKVFLRPSGALLQVFSAPGGASVILDGVVLGLTPFQRMVEKGSHELRVQLEGHEPQTRAVMLEPTRRESFDFTLEVSLTAPPLRVEAAPSTPEARTLERRLLMATLLDAASPLSEKRSALQKLIDDGGEATELVSSVHPAEHRSTLCLDFKQKVATARLEVRTIDAMKDPTPALLRLDGRPAVRAPVALDVPACIQWVEVESDAGVKQQRPVALSKASPTVLEFDLGGRPRLASLGLMGEMAWTENLNTQQFSLSDYSQYSGGVRFDYWARFFHFTVAAKASTMWTQLLHLPIAPVPDIFFGIGGASSGETIALHFAVDVGLWSLAVPTGRLTFALSLGRRVFLIVSGDLHLHPLVFMGSLLGSSLSADRFLFPGFQAGLSIAW